MGLSGDEYSRRMKEQGQRTKVEVCQVCSKKGREDNGTKAE